MVTCTRDRYRPLRKIDIFVSFSWLNNIDAIIEILSNRIKITGRMFG